ncbi:hypothetical protein D3C81_1811920 [compost metagenome]
MGDRQHGAWLAASLLPCRWLSDGAFLIHNRTIALPGHRLNGNFRIFVLHDLWSDHIPHEALAPDIPFIRKQRPCLKRVLAVIVDVSLVFQEDTGCGHINAVDTLHVALRLGDIL